jgi:putative tricarboxylic transport membrane protein
VKKLAIAATAVALIASAVTATPASAAAVKASNATVSTPCAKVNEVAKARGIDGSDLKCLVAKVGGYKGQKVWSYTTYPTIKSLDMVLGAALGSGYHGFGVEIAKALKAEGLVESEPTFTPIVGGSGSAALAKFISTEEGAAGKSMVIGAAMIGGVQANKAPVKVSMTLPLVRMMAEWNVVVVKADSKYTDLKSLVADIKANPKAVAIGGGSLGSADHLTVARIADAIDVDLTKMNYIPYSGGSQVTAAVLNGSTVAAGVSGWAEFKESVNAGKMRVLGVSAPSAVAAIPAKTFTEQGVKAVTQNWRGIALADGTTPAGYAKMLRVMDVLHASKTWKNSLKTMVWTDNFAHSVDFKLFVKEQETYLKGLYGKLGL